VRPATLLAALSALGLTFSLMVGPALATHVTPIAINSGNPTCEDFEEQYGDGQDWTEFKLQDDSKEGGPNNLQDGTYSDGTLTVTIDNFDGTSFDWSSNIGVDAVFVKAGNDKHNLYLYDPESLGDTGLQSQDGSGNGISHISFCYDAGDDQSEEPSVESIPPSVESVPPSVESVPPSVESVPPSVESVPPSVDESTDASVEGSVLGGTGTPEPSTPDTAFGSDNGPSPLPTIAFGAILLASLAGLACVNVQAVRTRS
jgi:hypothetical protein